MVSLEDKVGSIKGVGPKSEILLNKLEIFTIKDLLYHFPFRYEDRTRIYKISELTPNQEYPLIVKIAKITNIFTNRGFRITKATVEDSSGQADAVWFNQHFISKSLIPGTTILLTGKIDQDNKRPTFNSPEWEIIDPSTDIEKYLGLVPVYWTTEGISSKWIAKKIAEVLDNVEVEEYFPAFFREKYKLEHLNDAIHLIHHPKSFDELDKSKLRLSFDELLWLHLRGMKIRNDWNNKNTGHKVALPSDQHKNLLKEFKFELTDGQNRCIEEILKDLSDTQPMNRLLQGDVGSGKTVVAEVSLLAALSSGFNALLLAPTQVLAMQHYEKISKHFNALGYEVDLLTSNIKIKLESKKPTLVIATHSILHHMEEYQNVGLIVIDEQHKFGVSQRSKIIDHYTNENIVPNLLTMTATPIPRSLALTFYGDLDLSVIGEMPGGRKPTITKVIKETERTVVNGAIKTLLKDNQMFVVCPFIEESNVETLKSVKSAETEFIKIKKTFAGFKSELLHGKTKNKEEIIEKFAKGQIDILVATPVVEVGIDIPNANIILIETPERFGLASLHQLRGRVGRREKQGYCFLIASENIETGFKRLKNLETIHDGNKLAELDLKMRGPGNMYGTEQHGYRSLRIADITDIELIKKTKEAATGIFQETEKYPILFTALSKMNYIDDQ